MPTLLVRAKRPDFAILGFVVTSSLVLLLSWCLASRADAAELVMFEQRGCPFCAQFDAEIAPDYPRSAAGARAPLRRVDIYRSRDGGIAGLDPAVFTPTFVLIDGGREVGRLVGYPGRRYFYAELQALIEKMPAAEPAQ